MEGGGIAGQIAYVFTFEFSLQLGEGQMTGIYLRQKWQCKVTYNRQLEKTAVVLPTGCLSSVELLVGVCWMKSQSPRYSSGVKGGGVVTNDWCITKNFYFPS